MGSVRVRVRVKVRVRVRVRARARVGYGVRIMHKGLRSVFWDRSWELGWWG